MKHKLASILCVLILLIVPLSVHVSASNYTDTAITDFGISWFYYSHINYSRQKTDTTTLYLLITALSGSSAKVRALGCNSSMSITENLTVANGILVNYVTCAPNVESHRDNQHLYRYHRFSMDMENCFSESILDKNSVLVSIHLPHGGNRSL